MARYKSLRFQSIRFSDLAEFSDNDQDMDLLDIVNDTAKEKLDDNFISAPGAYVYELDLTIDEEKVVELSATGLKVEIFNMDPRKRLRSSSRSRRSQRARSRRRELREYLQQRVPSPILSFNIDFNIPLPTQNFQFLAKNLFVPKKRVTVAYFNTPPVTKTKFVSTPISAKPLMSIVKNTGVGLSFKKLARTSIFKKAKDPALMLAKPTPFYPTLAAKISFASTKLDAKPVRDQSKKITLDNIYTRRSLVEERSKVKTMQDDYSKDAIRLSAIASRVDPASLKTDMILAHKAAIESNLFSVKREIEIPKDKLGMRKKFYIRITPVLRKDKSLINVQKLAKPLYLSIDHKSKVDEMMEPISPPEIKKIMDKKGVIVLGLTQTDPAATAVVVTKRIFTPRKAEIQRAKTLSVVKMETTSAIKVVSDFDADNILPNNVLYRATTVSPTGNAGPSSSIVITGHTNVNIPAAAEDPNELSIVAANKENNIEITVERIPEDVIGLKLMRERLDISGEFYDRVKVIPDGDRNTLVDTLTSSRSVTFIDDTTLINRKYRYFCSLRPERGNEFLSEEDELIIRKKPMRPLPVDVSIENFQVTRVDEVNEFETTVELLSIPKPEGIDLLLRTLMQQPDANAVFIDAIKKNRSSFGELSAFIVERVDRVTGRRVSFGLHPAGTFKDDNETRGRLNIPPPVAGRRYSYFFKLCLAPPESFLKNVFTTFGSGKTPGVDDQKALSAKFLSALSATVGALPSNKDLTQGITVGQTFRLGETGTTLQADIRTPKPRPMPSGLIARRSKKRVFLKWEASGGDLSEVDHCLVFVDYEGKTVLLGTVVSPSRGNSFYFKDTKYSSQVGTKKYHVKFVYADLTLSPASNKITHVVAASIPRAFLSRRKKIRIVGIVKFSRKRRKVARQSFKKTAGIASIAKQIKAPGWNLGPFKKGR